MKKYKSNSYEKKIVIQDTDKSFPKAKISCAKDAADYARQFYFDDIMLYESFFIILLNQSHNTIGWVKISQGGTSSTVVDPKLIAKFAIESLAKRVVLVHNHPSGNKQPSESDKKTTSNISEGLKLFDMDVLDHIILTEDSFFAFSSEGLL